MRVIVGVDLGGTNIVVGGVPEDGGAVYALASERTPVQLGAEAVVQVIVRMIQTCVEGTRRQAPGADVVGVGIGAPGPLDTKRGIVIFAPNLSWHNMPLRDRIADAVRLPTTLDNDANCAVLGEWWQGAARGARLTNDTQASMASLAISILSTTTPAVGLRRSIGILRFGNTLTPSPVPRHRHRFRQRNILPTGLGHKTRPKRVRRKIPRYPGQGTPLLDDGPHRGRGERRAQMPPLTDSSEDCPRRDPACLKP